MLAQGAPRAEAKTLDDIAKRGQVRRFTGGGMDAGPSCGLGAGVLAGHRRRHRERRDQA